jgi:hypothetical protein
MLDLWIAHGKDKARVISAYAKSEMSGVAIRLRNTHNISSAQYAKRLLQDGLRRGWIKE